MNRTVSRYSLFFRLNESFRIVHFPGCVKVNIKIFAVPVQYKGWYLHDVLSFCLLLKRAQCLDVYCFLLKLFIFKLGEIFLGLAFCFFLEEHLMSFLMAGANQSNISSNIFSACLMKFWMKITCFMQRIFWFAHVHPTFHPTLECSFIHKFKFKINWKEIRVSSVLIKFLPKYVI